MKTFDNKDIFTCVTADEAITYIGNNGYFANDLQTLQSNIDVGLPSYLDVIDVTLCTSINHTFTDHMRTNYYGLCLPADKVKDVEDPKKWRAFKDTKEFLNAIHCTNHRWEAYSFGLRRKGKEKVFHVCICGITDNDILLPSFGRLSMHELFTNYERLSIDEELKEKFVPFGVEE